MPQLIGCSMARDSWEFLEVQRRLDCPDCSLAHWSGPRQWENEYAHRQIVGGGSVVWSKGAPIQEVHIIPHGGTELPADLLGRVSRDRWDALSDLVHANADTGTGFIYARLAEQIKSGELTGTAVAGFHHSRLLIDANRAEPAKQTPARPYVGEPELYGGYLRANSERLRDEYLLPWVAAVNQWLSRLTLHGLVYHHHTYDLTSLSPRPNDFGDKMLRPAFEFVWKRPDDGAVDITDESVRLDPRGGGLARLEDLKDARDSVARYLSDRYDTSHIDGHIDYPLELPLTPFTGTTRADLGDFVPHVMYDIRKDYLDTEEKILNWVDSGPWRVSRHR